MNQISKEISVIEFCNDNKLEIINKDKIKITTTIKRPAINRLGLELKGFIENENLNKNIIGWGTVESHWMSSIDKKDLDLTLSKIFNYNPPLVICSKGVSEENKKIIVKNATKFNVPVVFSDLPLSSITTTIGVYLSSFFAQSEFVHGSLIIINSIGVLVIGKSGIGKSEVILDLVQKNHIFVSDDAVLIKRIGNNFIGESPLLTQDILEARGLGLMNIRAIYGEKSIRKSTTIDLVVELEHYEATSQFDRLGNKNLFYLVLGGKINKIKIPVTPGRSVSSLVEAAVNLHISKLNGIDALEIIQNREKER
ncbi:MAG: HPr(Ser) kinase/phosphatase [Metamycoplasmataceae bacterium]